MNILESEKKSSLSKHEIVVGIGVHAKNNLVPRMNLHNGHKLYEIDEVNGILQEVVYKKTHIFYKGPEEFLYEKRPGCLYIPALNEKNALNKYSKLQHLRGNRVKEI